MVRLLHFVLVLLVIPTNGSEEQDTLILVNMIFRHGDRVHILKTYPNDPYRNASFFPYKTGELTRRGQNRLYQIGRHLQQRYLSFLGDLYHSDLLNATSSDYPRTKQSLQSLLAGLFFTTDWNPIEELPWQPIPIDVIPAHEDKYLAPHLTCPQLVSGLEYPETNEDSDSLTAYIAHHSGYPKVTPYEMARVRDATITAHAYGYAIPAWVAPILQPLTEMTLRFFETMQAQKKRYGGGHLLKKITSDLLAKALRRLEPQNRKLFLYSAHDFTVNFMLGALGLWRPEIITYGAFLLIELHQIDGLYGIKIYYDNNYKEPELMTLNGCDAFCPLEQFIALTRDVYTPTPVCC